MAQLYGQLVERFGFREIREVSIAEVQDFLGRPHADAEEQPEQADGGEITQEKYDEMVALMKADAAVHGKARPLG